VSRLLDSFLMIGLDADIGASGVLRNPRTFKGAGQVIAVNDTGFDTGSNDDTPPAFTGRILTMKNAHDPSLSVADTVSHGTAVAGCIVASGVCDEVGGDVSGIAPAARLVIQSLIDGDGNWSPVKLGIFESPYLDQNVRIVNSSFGPAHGFQPAYGDTEDRTRSIISFANTQTYFSSMPQATLVRMTRLPGWRR